MITCITGICQEINPDNDSLSVGFRRLQSFHEYYSRIDAEQRWTYFPTDTSLHVGDKSDWIFGLRSNLLLSGDLLAAQDMASDVMDTLLVKAITRFQQRHGLPVDGVFCNATLLAMNVPLQKRIEQIALNMERWRTFTGMAKQPCILVNIPDFSLQVIDQDSTLMKMKVIVGKKSTKTVLLQSEIRYVVLNPSWNVPNSIATKEILSLQQKNPKYLTDHQMRIYTETSGMRTEINPDSVDWQSISKASFNYRIEQVPGVINALGKIKFVFPNKHDIYLHDTAQKNLFSNHVRALSHGCVRVEKPVELAAYLLRKNASWSKRRIKEYISKENESTGVILKKSVPITLAYFTAWVENDSQLHFRNDIYRYDEQVIKPTASHVYVNKSGTE